MGNLNEYLIYQQLFQGGENLSQAIYVAAMFLVLIWRKESVVNWTLFRISYLLFAAALIVGHLVLPLIQMGGGLYRGNYDVGALISRAATGPALFAAAVVCGLASMMPRRWRAARPDASRPHPLD